MRTTSIESDLKFVPMYRQFVTTLVFFAVFFGACTAFECGGGTCDSDVIVSSIERRKAAEYDEYILTGVEPPPSYMDTESETWDVRLIGWTIFAGIITLGAFLFCTCYFVALGVSSTITKCLCIGFFITRKSIRRLRKGSGDKERKPTEEDLDLLDREIGRGDDDIPTIVDRNRGRDDDRDDEEFRKGTRYKRRVQSELEEVSDAGTESESSEDGSEQHDSGSEFGGSPAPVAVVEGDDWKENVLEEEDQEEDPEDQDGREGGEGENSESEEEEEEEGDDEDIDEGEGEDEDGQPWFGE